MKKLGLIFLLLTFFAHLEAQNLKRAFKNLKKQKYEKAEKVFTEVLTTNKMHVIANYGMALLHADTACAKHDWFKAYEILVFANENAHASGATAKELEKVVDYFTIDSVKVKLQFIDNQLFNYIKNRPDDLRKFLDKCPKSTNYKKALELFYAQEYEKAKQKNSLEAYQKFITECADASQVADAKLVMADLSFAQAKTDKKLESILAFLEKYPDSKHQAEGEKLRNSLAFEAVKTKNTALAYQEFLVEYPDAEQVSEVKKLRNKAAFAEAKKENTVGSLQAFIDSYPDAVQREEAQKNLFELAFAAAQTENTPEAFEEFIGEYPNSPQIADAKKQKARLEIDAVKSQNSADKYEQFMHENAGHLFYNEAFNGKANLLGTKFKTRLNAGGNLNNIRVFNFEKVKSKLLNFKLLDDGKMLVSVATQKAGAWFHSSQVLMLDAAGNYLWSSVINSAYDNKLNSLTSFKSGQCVLVGYTDSRKSSDGKAQVISFDANGKKLWEKTLFEGRAMAVAAFENTVVLAGYKNVNGKAQELVLIKLNANGETIWEQNFSETGIPVSLAMAANGNIYVAARNRLMKFNADGKKLWHKKFGKGEKAYRVLVTPAEAIFAAGTNALYTNKNKSNFWLAKFDAQSKKKWSKTYDKAQNYEFASSLASLPNGNILLCGLTENQHVDNIWLLEISPTGSKINDRIIGSSLNEKNPIVQVSPQGKITILSHSGLQSDIILLQLDKIN